MFDEGSDVFDTGPAASRSSLGAVRRRLQRNLDATTPADLSRRVVEGAAAVEAAEVALIQMVAAWDAGQAWAVDHALSPVPWLTQRTTRSRADAGRLVRSARLCRAVPVVAAALAAGDLSTTQLDLLAGAAGQGRAKLFAEHVDTLLGFATDLNIHDFTRVTKRWRELADDELGRTDPAARDAQEHVRLDATLDDKWRLSGLIGAELAALLQACLDHYDQPDAADVEAPRTRPQRDVDNLRALLKDLMGGTTGQPNITVTCVIDLDLLDPRDPATDGDGDPWTTVLPRLDGRCRINGLGDVERRVIEQMMCGSLLNRVIMRGGRCVLDYGRRARLFSRAQRDAIMIRDGFHCAVEGCQRTDLDVHHLHARCLAGNGLDARAARRPPGEDAGFATPGVRNGDIRGRSVAGCLVVLAPSPLPASHLRPRRPHRPRQRRLCLPPPPHHPAPRQTHRPLERPRRTRTHHPPTNLIPMVPGSQAGRGSPDELVGCGVVSAWC